MRIKVNDTWFTIQDGPLMIELTEQDKKNIQNMAPTCFKYCIWTKGFEGQEEEVLEWMSR